MKITASQSGAVLEADWTNRLIAARACGDAVAWARHYPTAQAAWDACERGDRMLWIWGRLDAGEPWSDKRKPIVLAAARCAETALPIYEVHYPGDRRPRNVVDLYTRWALGEEIAHEDLLAVDAAAYSYYAISASHYAYAADAAYTVAADAAYAVASVASVASARKKCADIVREIRPVAPAGDL